MYDVSGRRRRSVIVSVSLTDDSDPVLSHVLLASTKILMAKIKYQHQQSEFRPHTKEGSNGLTMFMPIKLVFYLPMMSSI